MTNARAFTDRLADLLRREHVAMADFLLAVADFDRRRLWLEIGHASLFAFLHRELGLSKGAAHYRKTAVELVQRFPEIVEPLRTGQLCITAVVHLAKVLTPENRHEVLPRFFHRSRREAMELAAAICPAEAAPRREVVTAVRPVMAVAASAAIPAPAPVGTRVLSDTPRARTGTYREIEREGVTPCCAVAAAQVAVQPAALPVDPAQVVVQPAEPRLDRGIRGPPFELDGGVLPGPATVPMWPPSPPPHASPSPRPALRDTAEPVTGELSRLHVTVSRRFLAKLEAARTALSHARPGATAEEILEAGLDLVLAQHAKRNGLVAKPRTQPPPARSNRVPAHVRRAVWTRDEGRCQWLTFGGDWMDRFTRRPPERAAPRGSPGAG